MMRALFARLWTPRFKPQVFYSNGMDLTQLLLEDGYIVWCPCPGCQAGHVVDLGYNEDGKLVGVQVWTDVTTREALEKIR
jgi:hypothetical protein